MEFPRKHKWEKSKTYIYLSKVQAARVNERLL